MFSLKPPNVAELLVAQFPVGEDGVSPGRGQTLVVEPQSWQQGDAQPGPALRSLPQPLQQVVSLARPLHLSRQENINLEDIKSVMKGQSLSWLGSHVGTLSGVWGAPGLTPQLPAGPV